MLRVVFVRHGETTNNLLHADKTLTRLDFEKKRSADAPITERGVKQAVAAGARAWELAPEASLIMCSFYDRALRTAQAIQECYNSKLKELAASASAGNNDDGSANEDVAPSPPTVPALVSTEVGEVGGLYKTDSEGVDSGLTGRTAAETLDAYRGFLVLQETRHSVSPFATTVANGLNRQQLDETESADHVARNGWWTAEMGRENFKMATRRADYLLGFFARAALEIKQKAKEDPSAPMSKTIVVVTHGNFYDLTMRRMEKTLPNVKFATEWDKSVHLKNTAFTIVNVTPPEKDEVVTKALVEEEAMASPKRKQKQLEEFGAEDAASADEPEEKLIPLWDRAGVFVELVDHRSVSQLAKASQFVVEKENDASHLDAIGVL